MTAPTARQAAGKIDLACRFLLSLVFLSTGIASAFSLRGFALGLDHMGVPFPMASAAATMALNLAAPIALIIDIAGLGWIAAFMLAAFTAVTIPFGHAFWQFAEPQRTEEMRIAIEHVSLIGGLLLTGLASLRRWKEHRSRLPSRDRR